MLARQHHYCFPSNRLPLPLCTIFSFWSLLSCSGNHLAHIQRASSCAKEGGPVSPVENFNHWYLTRQVRCICCWTSLSRNIMMKFFTIISRSIICLLNDYPSAFTLLKPKCHLVVLASQGRWERTCCIGAWKKLEAPHYHFHLSWPWLLCPLHMKPMNRGRTVG